ncbi:hypothetical protein FGG08_003654 [Glutinoglossum americanum]|uniref:Uncharacterized protein n=1 Tax=Glutinoglossum americanum TaxID=1670608 RepID=A0A9P8I7A3_9PEZI|nr:hypothetical protein FGG08_003654 [Glutinoglossum americanum]
MVFAGAGMLAALGALCRALAAALETALEDFSTLLSARDLSCSDQLKPSPERREDMSDFILGERLVLLVLALADEDKPRPLAVGEETKVEALPLAALPFPARTSLSAFAPKLMRRAKGEAGGGPAASPSSMTFSSSVVAVPMEDVEPTLVLLSRRALNGDVWVGDVPDNPSVVKDIRRRFWA